MAGIKDFKGLGDLRTSLSARVRSMPKQKGTAHRDMYLLSKEKERLEDELTRLERLQKRVGDRLKETVEIIVKLHQEALADEAYQGAFTPTPSVEVRTPPPRLSGDAQWKTIPLDY